MNRKQITSFIKKVLNLTENIPYNPDWASIDSRPVPSWFEDAKFGIFVHWGLYSVPSYSPTGNGAGSYDRYAEHYWHRLKEPGKVQADFKNFHHRMYGPDIQYADFADHFKAELFQPEEWAKRFKESGAKYVVLTSKHHEGFPLWPSAYSPNWNAMDRGPNRDLLGDLTKAVRGQDLKMGYYYSILEWYHPLYKKETIQQYVDQHLQPQMKELVNNYKPDLLWPDGEWDYPSLTLKSTQFLSWLFNESPVKDHVVINDRWGKETRSRHGGYFTTEYDFIHNDDSTGTKFEKPWEECRAIAGSFGYNRMEVLEDYSTSEELVHLLINKVARGGNLLLNIGPTADGRIPVIMQQRLYDVGQWLKVNGEAIYGTRKWDMAPGITKQTTQYFTRKGNDLFVIYLQFPDKAIDVNVLKKPDNVTMLGLNENLKSEFSNGRLIIIPPAVSPGNNPCNYSWVFKLQNAL